MRIFFTIYLVFATALVFGQRLVWVNPCDSVELCYDFNSCTEATAKLTFPAVTTCNTGKKVSYTYRVDLGSNGTVDLQASGDTIKAKFPTGKHLVYWRAVDQCGEALTCFYTVTVKDCQIPNLLCTNGLTQGLNDSCKAVFYAGGFITQLSDNCTPLENMEITVKRLGEVGFPTNKSLTYDRCETGFNIVEIWVRDAAGHTNSCQNYVLVQENVNKCPCVKESKINLGGCVRNALGKQAPQYELVANYEYQTAANPGVSTKKSLKKSTTDSCFALTIGSLPVKVNVNTIVTGARKSAITEGMTTLDLVLISKHLLGTEPFKSFYQIVAADINQSKSLSAFDIVEGRKALLGLYDTFPSAPSWRFIRPVSNPAQTDAWAELNDRYELSHKDLAGDAEVKALNFVGIKMGDVNFSANLTGEAEDRGAPLPLEIPAGDIKAGEETRIPVLVGDDVLAEGWQLALRLDPLEGEISAVEGVASDDYHIGEDASTVRVLHYAAQAARLQRGDTLFFLKVKAQTGLKPTAALSLDHSALTAELYTENNQRRPFELKSSTLEVVSGNVRVEGPFPNPARDQAAIGIVAPDAQRFLWSLFDAEGRLIEERWIEAPEGYSQHRVAARHSGHGLFVWRLAGADTYASGKIILMP